MKRLITLLLSAVMAVASYAAFLPSVGTGTAPNQWTSNVEGVLKAAKTTGYPIFVLIINDSNDGEGCSHCATFLQNTINTAAFEKLKRSNTFYLVLLNYWREANGYHGNIDPYYSRWYTRGTGVYANANVLPVIAVVDPSSGAKAQGWGVPWGDGGNKTDKIKAVLDRYVKRTSRFSIEAESTAVSGAGTWQGRVARSGGSGLAGSVALSLSGPHAAYYTVSPSTLSWGADDGELAFTVTGPSSQVDDILYDEITVSIAGSCPGGDVAYGNQSKALSFRDARIKKSLSEFAADRDGLKGLTAASEIWFSSTENSLALETIMDAEEDVLTLNATMAGTLTLALPTNFPASASATATWTSSGKSASSGLAAKPLTIGVSIGDKVEIKVTNTAADTLVGFDTFEFAPLSLSLGSPAAGTILSWPDVCANASLVDFSWASNAGKPSYELYLTQGGIGSVFAETPVNMGADTRANGIDKGLVRTDIVMGNCWWGVKVTDISADIGRAAMAVAAGFAITAKPEYDSSSVAVTGYLKCGAGFNFSAWAPEGTGSITYSLSGTLPSGLSFDKATGQISGTPKKAGTYSVTVNAANAYGSASKTVTITVAKFPTSLKGNYNGIFFAGKSMPYSMTWKVSTSGKWTGKLVQSDGKTKSVKGTVVFDEGGRVSLESPVVTIRQVPGTSLWTGSWGGATLYGKVTEKKIAASAVGLWTAGAQVGGDRTTGAYVVAKITSNGKVSFSGKANAKLKLSGKGQALALSGAEIATFVPEWNNGGQSGVFAQGCKKTSGMIFCGGFAYWQDRSCEGLFTFAGRVYDWVEGSFWNTKQSFVPLDGSAFAGVCDFGEIEFGVTATDKKLYTDVDGVKISAKKTKGMVSGSFKSGKKTCKFEGVLFDDRAGGLKAFGGMQGGCFMIGK